MAKESSKEDDNVSRIDKTAPRLERLSILTKIDEKTTGEGQKSPEEVVELLRDIWIEFFAIFQDCLKTSAWFFCLLCLFFCHFLVLFRYVLNWKFYYCLWESKVVKLNLDFIWFFSYFSIESYAYLLVSNALVHQLLLAVRMDLSSCTKDLVQIFLTWLERNL